VTVLESYSHIGFTCVTRPLADVTAAVRRTLRRPELRRPFVRKTGKVDLARIYSSAPPPGSLHPKHVLAFSPTTSPDSTVVFANRADGWQTLSVAISKLIPDHVYCFALSNGDEWPLYRFEVLDSGDTLRHVSVIKDVDRWKFWQTGEPLAEEDVAVYKKRRIKDRLTREYLVSLAERLGFPIGDDRFWQSDSEAVYFEEQRAARRQSPEARP